MNRKRHLKRIIFQKIQDCSDIELLEIEKYFNVQSDKINDNQKQLSITKSSNEQQNLNNNSKQKSHKKLNIKFSKQKKLIEYKLAPKKQQRLNDFNQEQQNQLSSKQVYTFQCCLKNLKEPRKQTRASKKRVSNMFINDSTAIQKRIKPYIFIYDQYYYLQGSSVNDIQINFIDPTRQYKQINYQLDSQQEFNEAKGEELNSENQQSLDDSENSEQDQFCVSDGHLSADQISSDEGEQNNKKILYQTKNINQWMFTPNSNQDLKKQFLMYGLVDNLPLQIKKQDAAQILANFGDKISEVNKICHKNSRAKILESLKKDLGIQKNQSIDYLKNFCKKKRVNNKMVYVVLNYEPQDEQSKKIKNKDNNDSNKQIQQNTNEEEEQIFQITNNNDK